MNSEEIRQLLTAAIDGELTPSERVAAKRLLRESAEARELFSQLQRDSLRIKHVPRVNAPVDLSASIMGAIYERNLSPIPLPPSRSADGKRWTWGFMLATAAGLMLAVTSGILYLRGEQSSKPLQRVNVAVASPEPSADDMPVVVVANEAPPKSVARAIQPEAGPTPREVLPDVMVSPTRPDPGEIQAIQLDAIRLSSFFTVRELPGDATLQSKLLAELKKDELIRLDLFAVNVSRGTDLVQQALRDRGIEVHVDAFAQDRRRKNLATEMVVFTEAMTPDEVAQFLTRIGADEKRWPSPVFDTLVVAPFLPKDLTQLGGLLGVPGMTPNAKSRVDVNKPLPEGTANQVAMTLTRMGSTGSARPAPRTDKVAVVMSYSPVNTTPGASKEVRQFLDRRGEKRPNAKPLMLVVRAR